MKGRSWEKCHKTGTCVQKLNIISQHARRLHRARKIPKGSEECHVQKSPGEWPGRTPLELRMTSPRQGIRQGGLRLPQQFLQKKEKKQSKPPSLINTPLLIINAGLYWRREKISSEPIKHITKKLRQNYNVLIVRSGLMFKILFLTLFACILGKL